MGQALEQFWRTWRGVRARAISGVWSTWERKTLHAHWAGSPWRGSGATESVIGAFFFGLEVMLESAHNSGMPGHDAVAHTCKVEYS